MKLHTEISGRGPVLGMIHGWGLHGGIWGPAQGLLERDFRLVRVDLPDGREVTRVLEGNAPQVRFSGRTS